MAEAAGDRLAITQYLLTGYAGEPAMLELIAEGVSPGDVLVTYNGRSFDLPLLATRYRINGLADPLAHLAHCDLLHPVRRLFSSRWPDCRLATAESALLGYRRRGDLPGAFAPDAWFAYLRRGDASALAAVCEHNARDLASLPALRAVLHAAVSAPEPGKVDIGALAGWLRRSDEPAALELLAAHEAHLSGPGLRLLGDLLRRAGRTGEASRVWDALAASGCVRATEQLAKYQEHVCRDIASALGYADRLPDSAARRHRVDRLRKKLNRAAAGLDFENRPDP